jgi:hypothetical protein
MTQLHETEGKRIELTFTDVHNPHYGPQTLVADNIGIYKTGAWQLRNVEDGKLNYIFDREVDDLRVLGDTPEQKTFILVETITEVRKYEVTTDADADEEQIRNTAYNSREYEVTFSEVTEVKISPKEEAE